MAVDGQILEDAGEAFYRALRVYGGANDYGHSSTRTFIVETFKTVAIDVAVSGGEVTSEEAATIDSMFYLDRGGIEAIAADAHGPGRADTAIDDLIALIPANADDVSAEAIVDAADRLITAAAAIAGGGEKREARVAEVMAKLREKLPSKEVGPASAPQGLVGDAGAPTPPASPLVPVDCPARLRDGETCYAVTSATLYQERSRVSRVRYGGLSGNVHIARGINYRTGSYAVDQTRTPTLAEIGSGELCITDQRLIFLSSAKSLDLPFTHLLSTDTAPGEIMVARPNAGVLLFEQVDDAAVTTFEQVTGTSPARREEIERQQLRSYEASLDQPDEPTSHLWRNLILIVVLAGALLYLRHKLLS